MPSRRPIAPWPIAAASRPASAAPVSAAGGGGAAVVELPPLRSFGGGELSLLASMGFDREQVETVIRLVASGALDLSTSVTDVIPLPAINEGFRRAVTQEGDPIRIVVGPGG